MRTAIIAIAAIIGFHIGASSPVFAGDFIVKITLDSPGTNPIQGDMPTDWVAAVEKQGDTWSVVAQEAIVLMMMSKLGYIPDRNFIPPLTLGPRRLPADAFVLNAASPPAIDGGSPWVQTQGGHHTNGGNGNRRVGYSIHSEKACPPNVTDCYPDGDGGVVTVGGHTSMTAGWHGYYASPPAIDGSSPWVQTQGGHHTNGGNGNRRVGNRRVPIPGEWPPPKPLELRQVDAVWICSGGVCWEDLLPKGGKMTVLSERRMLGTGPYVEDTCIGNWCP